MFQEHRKAFNSTVDMSFHVSGHIDRNLVKARRHRRINPAGEAFSEV